MTDYAAAWRLFLAAYLLFLAVFTLWLALELRRRNRRGR